MSYTGKVALITGGGSGMGRLTAHNCAATGAKVAILDVNEQGMEETAATSPNIHCYKVDITDTDQVNQVVARVEEELGPIDRVYNAAAIMPYGKLLEFDIGLANKMMAINYGGLTNIANATLPGMLERGKGDFVSFGSIAGIAPGMLGGHYAASKAAVVMFTEILYHENRNRGVRFACVCPPAVATPLLDQAKDNWPKAASAKPLDPQMVLKKIEIALDKGKFWVFPDTISKFGVLLRRLSPALGWRIIHRSEGW